MYLICKFIVQDIIQYHILTKMNIRMLESYGVRHCSAFWKKEEQFLVLEWDMNVHCTLTQHTMVHKNILKMRSFS